MELLQQGQKLSINIQKEEKLVEIIGTINEILEDRLRVELPPYFMRYIKFLDVGKELTVKVFSKIGTIDFNTVVISSPLEDEFFEIEFDANALQLTQGNEVPIIGAMEKLKINSKDGTFFSKTFEISTEYIKFYSDQKYELEELFSGELILPDDYGTISFKGTIKERDPVYDKEYTATFYSMSEYDRQALLYYMYIYANNSN